MMQSEYLVNQEGYRYTKDPTSLTQLLKGTLWISFGAAVLQVLYELNLLIHLDPHSLPAEELVNALESWQVINLIFAIPFLVSMIIFLIWVYRMNLNCHGFGAKDMKFSPGWAVGYFFIPIINLYEPYQVVKEIWKCSKNPSNWQDEEGTPLIAYWWIGYWLSFILSRIGSGKIYKIDAFSLLFGYARFIETLKEAMVFFIISGILKVISIISLILLVSRIYAMQERLVKQGP